MTNVLLCDVDGTLVDRQATFRGWARELLRRYGADRAEELRWIVLTDQAGHAPRAAFLEAVRRRYGLTDPVRELLRWYSDEAMPRHARPMPRARETLATMKGAGWILTAVTNGGTGQVGKLRSCGLLPMFNEVVLSEAEGFAKPAPELFEIALRRCVGRAPSQQDWVMGDNPRNDIWAGTRAGLRTVWVSWGRQWPPFGYHPHLIAPSLPAAAAALLAAAPARTAGS